MDESVARHPIKERVTAETRHGRPVPTAIRPSGALMLAALASSWALRGPRRSLTVLAIASTIAAGGEALAIRGTRTLRHHSQPQIGELPVAIPLLWYTYVVPCYGLAQAAVGERGLLAVSLVTALLATATDLANDPYGLASGFWEWRDGGPYLPDVVGPNGVAGIPIGNYVGWLVIGASVAALAEQGRRPDEHTRARRLRTLLLGLYWLLGVSGLRWAAQERRWALLGGSASAVLGGGLLAWLAARTDRG